MIREVARYFNLDIVPVDGGLVLAGAFQYFGGDGSLTGTHGSPFDFIVDHDFIKRLCAVFGVTALGQIGGRFCYVTHDEKRVHVIEPLAKVDGVAFYVTEWSGSTFPTVARSVGRDVPEV